MSWYFPNEVALEAVLAIAYIVDVLSEAKRIRPGPSVGPTPIGTNGVPLGALFLICAQFTVPSACGDPRQIPLWALPSISPTAANRVNVPFWTVYSISVTTIPRPRWVSSVIRVQVLPPVFFQIPNTVGLLSGFLANGVWPFAGTTAT